MAPKRALGLGKLAQLKKQKSVSSETSTKEVSPSGERPSNDSEEGSQQQLTVELDETADPNDEFSQLRLLWKTYVNSNRENELVLNGIIHECDRLLRLHHNLKESNGQGEGLSLAKIDTITEEFHAIYASLLSELAKFNTANNQVAEFFDAGIERAQIGLDQFPKSGVLKYVIGTIRLNRIPLQYISQMTVDSKKKQYPDIKALVDESIAEVADVDGEGFDLEILEFYETFDDLLDIVSNFGEENLEGLDSEDEEIEEKEEDSEEEQVVELSKKHPLYELQQDIPRLSEWWRQSLQKRYEVSIKDEEVSKKVASKLGKSYLQELEIPTQVFTSLKYDDESDESDEKEAEMTRAREEALKLCNLLIPLLSKLSDEAKPDSMVDLLELEINLGNLYDVGSEEQERLYKLAETKLRKLNNITHGKYQNILDNLLGEGDD